MSDTTTKYPSLADVYRDLTLFFKLDQAVEFSLTDFPSIAEGRWSYFKNNWSFIRKKYIDSISALPNGPVKTAATLQEKDFNELVESNRSYSQNPLSSRNTFRRFKDLFEVILINDLEVSQAEQKLIDTEIQRINNLRKDDFYQMRERVRITHDKAADSMGLSDANYNALLDRVSAPQIMSFQFSSFSIFKSLIDLMNQITTLIPTEDVEVAKPDPFATIRQVLNNPDIPVASYTNSQIIPFPAGSNLERLASKYLGSPDKWLEIATANNLKFPYIDELGRKVSLLVNGIGSSLLVTLKEFANFAINQEVFVGSDGQKLTRRKVIKIEEDKNNDQLLLTLDGPSDLSSYTTTQRAYVFFYLLNTVNSSKFIMIPAPGGVGFQVNSQSPWFVKELPSDLQNAGVDLALGIDTDLVIDNTGDLKLSYGMANLAQALNLKVQIKTNELMRSPEFGIAEIAGNYKNSDINDSLITLLIESAIGGDDRFQGTDGIGYTITETSIFINASIRVAGAESSIPLTFELPRG